MKPSDLVRNILTDIKVKVSEEFDRNFERKAFFDKKWPSPSLHNSRGSTLMRSGQLRRSIRSRIHQGQIRWSSSQPQANLLNQGGTVTVTPRMKKFFWAMYYKESGAKGKSKRPVTQRAEQWKALALQKTGKKMKVKQYQFLGHHPKIDTMVKEVVRNNMKEIKKYIKPKR